ncbi:MAG: hypothetical protein JWN46_4026, partial [Acidimicrobiales bacterium]|nr:hypothetical protein [Acidimicrobiales bacterium]
MLHLRSPRLRRAALVPVAVAFALAVSQVV